MKAVFYSNKISAVSNSLIVHIVRLCAISLTNFDIYKSESIVTIALISHCVLLILVYTRTLFNVTFIFGMVMCDYI